MAIEPKPSIASDFDWIEAFRLENPTQVRSDLNAIWRCGATPDLLDTLKTKLIDQFSRMTHLDSLVTHLANFVAASRNPTSLLALFERDSAALPALLQAFSTSQSLANRLVADPSSFDLLRANEGQPVERRFLVDELTAEIATLDRAGQATAAIENFVAREKVRIAYGEFVRGMSPEKVGRQLAYVADAVIEAALQFTVARLSERRPLPRLSDGSQPQVTIVGLGRLGGEEIEFSSALQLVFLYDRIEINHPLHREFYTTLVRDMTALLCPGTARQSVYDIDLRNGPKYDVGVPICSLAEATRIYETSGRIWHRMRFVKARTVAGSKELGDRFIRRLQPWIYQRFLRRIDLAEIRTLRHRLERRAEQQQQDGHDIANDPGGRCDLEMTVQFLQLLHGGDLAAVRCANTHEAIVALERAGCLTHQEATLLSDNYARFCRLQHQLSVTFEHHVGVLPDDPDLRGRLAWQLGIRLPDGSHGDTEKFNKLLGETFQVNRRMINHLMLDAPHEEDAVAVETELLLDPEPDPESVRQSMEQHGLADAKRAMHDLASLSTESVSFLSPHRCRHFFASLAPALLSEISRTPDPHGTLSSLVRVTDSLGAKATLWELLSANPPTMKLMVRLCAAAPYLSDILTDNPGMIDELVDSLLMNRLPSTHRLDAHSIELCRGATDIERILNSFKAGAHLMIGVRDVLGKEPLEATHAALADTAEACLRRMIDYEQEQLAQQYGDPSAPENEDAQLITLALGKLGGREPNYHSDLDAIFLYSTDGETQRRVGGRRATTTHQHFFNQLAQRVVTRINHVGSGGRLYELDSRLKPTGEEGLIAVSVGNFLRQFRVGSAPLWQRLALCKARAISASSRLRRKTDEAIAAVICETNWHPGMAVEIRQLRQRMEQTASPDNLKRAAGGTTDVEMIAQMLTLRHAGQAPQIIRPGVTASLQTLAEAGFLSEEDSLQLISGYRTLRQIEARLRLMNTPARHELPEDDESMRNLAFLMNEPNPSLIVTQCQQARRVNRRLFDRIFDQSSS
ncbi:MAG: glutamate-ammonia-ligase adenylyltransferase [Pirellulales bacterium]|nr:glutamate-ammonia-ligase adenylyltransferase [Pirellulales bacterium]